MKKYFKAPDAYNPGDIIISSEELETRLDEIVLSLTSQYKNRRLLLIGLLTGAAWLSVDLLWRLHKLGVTDVELAFIKVSSYPSGTRATHDPHISYETAINPVNRNILLVDDIADTGKTMVAIIKCLKVQKAKTIKSLVLLDKPTRREVSYKPDYCGFEIPNIWVQGRGLDSDGYGRGDLHIRKGPYFY